MGRILIRLIGAAGFAVVLAWMIIAPPAEACGCGGYVPRDGDAFIAQERALVRWDGRTEDIVMALDVKGSSSEAAWIMPVPSRATVKLSDPKIFDALQELTKPLVKQVARPVSLGAGAAAPGALNSVIVLDRQNLGPFDVSNLAASDAAALSDWLKTNGYNLDPRLAQVFQPYVAQNWYYIAVRLRPGAGDALKGALDPLWMTFSSDRLIYPMRASAVAPATETALLYILADHRAEKVQSFGGTHVAFANWVDAAGLAKDSPLAPFITKKYFLTKFEERVDPSAVNGDFEFTLDGGDVTYRDVQLVYVDDPFGTITGLLVLVLFFCVLPILVVVVVLVLLVLLARRLSKRQAPARP